MTSTRRWWQQWKNIFVRFVAVYGQPIPSGSYHHHYHHYRHCDCNHHHRHHLHCNHNCLNHHICSSTCALSPLQSCPQFFCLHWRCHCSCPLIVIVIIAGDRNNHHHNICSSTMCVGCTGKLCTFLFSSLEMSLLQWHCHNHCHCHHGWWLS